MSSSDSGSSPAPEAAPVEEGAPEATEPAAEAAPDASDRPADQVADEVARGEAEVFTAVITAETVVEESDRIDLDAYSGPLDLLLYLIKEEEVDIFDIPVARILEQFVDYLEKIRDLDIDKAGEFLLMASTLMEIKSKMLLPAGEIEEIEAEDPRSELVRQLLEYKRFKQLAIRFEEMAAKRANRWSRLARESFEPEPIEEEEPDDLLHDVTVYHLAASYEELLRETMGGGPARLVYDDISVEERIEDILALLRENPVRPFGELLTEEEGVQKRLDVVGTFLACLELTRRRLVRVLQGGDQAEIIVQVRAGEEADETRPLSLDELAGRVGRPIHLDAGTEEMVEELEVPDAGVLTRESIALSLRELGLAEGDVVVVHSSFKSLGPVDGGPRAVALAVCDAVGEAGTVVMPAWTKWKPGLTPNPEGLDIATGAIPKTFSEIPDVIRDGHFINSWVSRGPRARELAEINERRAFPAGVERLMSRIADLSGKVLLLGVGYESAAAVAAGEELSRTSRCQGRRDVSNLTRDDFLALDAEKQEAILKQAAGDRERDYGKLEPTVVSMGIEMLGEVGEAEVRLVGAKELIQTAAGALDANPELLVMTKEEVIKRRRAGDAQKRRHFKGINKSHDLAEMDKEELALKRRIDQALKRADAASERIEALREGRFTLKAMQEATATPAEGEAAEEIPEGALTREMMANKFRAMGIEAGDTLVVHSSLSSLGYVHGGALALIAALLDVIDETGTLVMPAFTDYDPAGPADPTLMKVWTGTVGLTLSRMAGAVRSRHPLYSWAIYSPSARELATIDNARLFPRAEDDLLHRLAKMGGKVVLIGVGHDSDSTIDLIEDASEPAYLARRREHSELTVDEFVALDDEAKAKVLDDCLAGPTKNFAAIEGPLREAGVQTRGKLGAAWIRIVSQGDLLRVGLEALNESPALLVAEEDRDKPEFATAPPPDSAMGLVPERVADEAEPVEEVVEGVAEEAPEEASRQAVEDVPDAPAVEAAPESSAEPPAEPPAQAPDDTVETTEDEAASAVPPSAEAGPSDDAPQSPQPPHPPQPGA